MQRFVPSASADSTLHGAQESQEDIDLCDEFQPQRNALSHVELTFQPPNNTNKYSGFRPLLRMPLNIFK